MKSLLSILALALTPVLAFAQEAPITRTVDGFLNYMIYIASRALPLLILAAVVLLLFGILKMFFFKSDNSQTSEGKKFIGWGIVALFVMVSVWGLVNVLRGTFQLDNNNVPLAPAIPLQQAAGAIPTAGQGPSNGASQAPGGFDH